MGIFGEPGRRLGRKFWETKKTKTNMTTEDVRLRKEERCESRVKTYSRF